MRTRLLFVAKPGQIRLGGDEKDPLVNVDVVPVVIEGFAIPSHIDGYGHPISQGFDIFAMFLDQEADFASSHALVHLDVGQQLHWRQCQEAVQWADEQVGLMYRSKP